MNFSSSYSGGGLRRLVETAKCFDKRDGCYFIIHQKAYKYLKDYCKNNVYYVVTQNKIRRLFDDGYYLQNILDVIGTPDIYFSYGIPIFFRIGKVNWFHISNALSLTTQTRKAICSAQYTRETMPGRYSFARSPSPKMTTSWSWGCSIRR